MTAGQILWLIIDIVMGLAIVAAIVFFIIIFRFGNTGSTSKRPKKKEKTVDKIDSNDSIIKGSIKK